MVFESLKYDLFPGQFWNETNVQTWKCSLLYLCHAASQYVEIILDPLTSIELEMGFFFQNGVKTLFWNSNF